MMPLALVDGRAIFFAHVPKTGGTAVEDVVDACGFGSVETRRRHFQRLRGVPPSRHRAMFGR